MEYKKLLLGAASVLAVSAGVAPVAIAADHRAIKEVAAKNAETDPLLDLVVRTGGSFTAEAVSTALAETFEHVSPAQAEAMPQLMADLASLGLSDEALDAARETMKSRIASSKLSVAMKMTVTHGLVSQEHSQVQLAENANVEPWCDPKNPRYDPNDPNCPPLTTEAIGENGISSQPGSPPGY